MTETEEKRNAKEADSQTFALSVELSDVLLKIEQDLTGIRADLNRVEAKTDLLLKRIKPKYTLAELLDESGPMWGVSITTADAEKGCEYGRTIEVERSACSGKDALMKALHEIDLAMGELLHTIHIGPPFKREAVAYQEEDE